MSTDVSGDSSLWAFGSPSTNVSSFSFSAVKGSDRVLVLAYDAVFSPPAATGSTTLAAVKNFDNQQVPGSLNGGNPVVLTPSDETTSAPITYGSLPSGFSSQGTTANLLVSGETIVLAVPATSQYPVLPSGAIENGDAYSIKTIASNGSEVTSIAKTLTAAGPVAFNYPAVWSYSGPVPSSTPTFNVSYSGFSGNNRLDYRTSWTWTAGGVHNYANVYATANYLNGGTSITWPDISAVTGFLSLPVSGTYVNWSAGITQTIYDSNPASISNATVTSVANEGVYQIP